MTRESRRARWVRPEPEPRLAGWERNNKSQVDYFTVARNYAQVALAGWAGDPKVTDRDFVVAAYEASQIIGEGGQILGRITSSRRSPTLGYAICLGQVDPSIAAPGTVITVRLPDGRDISATVREDLAFVDPEGVRLRA